MYGGDKMQMNLIELRKKFKLTQKDMANLLGIATKTYNNKENGKVEFLLSEMFSISSYFNLPVDEIFYQEILQNGVKSRLRLITN